MSNSYYGHQFHDLRLRVIEWAKDRGIFEKSDALKQLEKTEEEVKELSYAVSLLFLHQRTADREEVKLEMGDVLVTLILASEFLEIDMLECLEMAYNKISKRRGEMRNGVFVKSEDL